MKNKIYHTTQPACRLRMIVGLLLFVAAGMSAASTPILVIDSLNKKLPQLKGEERLAAMEAIYNQSLLIGDFDLQLKVLDEWQTEAHRQGNTVAEAEARVNRILDYFNEAIYDSIFSLSHDMMEFSEEHGMVRQKMQAWHMLVGAYHFTGQYNQALREVKMMYEEAHRLGSEYGESMAYFNMGNVYYSMSHYEESVDAFEKSIPLMRNIDQSVLLEIYPYYCDALDALHQYDKLESATVDWKKVIDHRLAQGDNRDLDVILANYFIACAQGKLGLNRLEEAEELLNETAIHVPEKNNYEWLYLLFYRAKRRLSS